MVRLFQIRVPTKNFQRSDNSKAGKQFGRTKNPYLLEETQRDLTTTVTHVTRNQVQSYHQHTDPLTRAHLPCTSTLPTLGELPF